jgi:hypothetical protein
MDSIKPNNLPPSMKGELEAMFTMTPAEVFRRMLRYFRGKNPHPRELAVRVFERCGQLAHQWLAGELVAGGRKDPYRLAVLDLLEAIGRPLEAGDFFTVMSAIWFKPPVAGGRCRCWRDCGTRRSSESSETGVA